MERIYYDSKTGNTERFINEVVAATGWEAIKIHPDMPIGQRGHLVTFTTRFGEVPETTDRFLQEASPYIESVSSSGNRNWGRNYGVAMDKINTQYGIPAAIKFVLSGTPDDVKHFIDTISNKHYDNKRGSKELDFAQ